MPADSLGLIFCGSVVITAGRGLPFRFTLGICLPAVGIFRGVPASSLPVLAFDARLLAVWRDWRGVGQAARGLIIPGETACNQAG